MNLVAPKAYIPRRTAFLSQALSAGCEACDRLEVLVGTFDTWDSLGWPFMEIHWPTWISVGLITIRQGWLYPVFWREVTKKTAMLSKTCQLGPLVARQVALLLGHWWLPIVARGCICLAGCWRHRNAFWARLCSVREWTLEPSLRMGNGKPWIQWLQWLIALTVSVLCALRIWTNKPAPRSEIAEALLQAGTQI